MAEGGGGYNMRRLYYWKISAWLRRVGGGLRVKMMIVIHCNLRFCAIIVRILAYLSSVFWHYTPSASTSAFEVNQEFVVLCLSGHHFGIVSGRTPKLHQQQRRQFLYIELMPSYYESLRNQRPTPVLPPDVYTSVKDICICNVLLFFLSLFWSGHRGSKAYSLWGGVIPSLSIGYDYL